MILFTRATLIRVSTLVVCTTILFVRSACADDLTGQPHDDPKDLLPTPPEAPAPCANPDGIAFAPLPNWAERAVMPPLPATLRPNGAVAVLTTPPKPAAATPAPAVVKDATPTVIVSKPMPAPVAPAAPPEPTSLIAVSPFLDWIKANPREAAQQARQEAGTYATAPDAGAVVVAPAGTAAVAGSAPVVAGPVVAGSTAPAGANAQVAAPYWMPPLIDTAPFSTSGGSSAAIYTTPQR
jgi:hypothetical protein